jgi:ribose/xylose/arabinose/galactoside ABC-type transport system permease subunit
MPVSEYADTDLNRKNKFADFLRIMRIGTVFGFYKKIRVMLPVWFFIVLILLICYLLYVTRTTEENFLMMSRNHFRKIQFWVKGTPEK